MILLIDSILNVFTNKRRVSELVLNCWQANKNDVA